MHQEELYVATDEQLSELIERLRGSGVLGMDTEFVRERTYFPLPCLLQLADERTIACIDPLTVKDMSPLLDLIYDPEVVKVVHAGRQDFEILFHMRGSVPRPVFDTQLAGTLLGMGDQVSYAALVESELGVKLDKGHTRTDWCRRPLDPGQVRYALDDVRYLPTIHARQTERLKAMGRLQWLDEDFDAMTASSCYEPDPDGAWRRIKGTNKLRGAQRAVLHHLAAWREREAIRSDRPRRWVIKDEVMLAVAQRIPSSERDLDRIRGVDRSLVERHGKDIVAAVHVGLNEPQSQWPDAAAHCRLTQEQEALVDAAMAVLKTVAAQQKVSAQSLAARRDLEKLVAGERDLPLLHGWRGAIAGRALMEFLDGQSSLSTISGRLQIVRGAAS